MTHRGGGGAGPAGRRGVGGGRATEARLGGVGGRATRRWRGGGKHGEHLNE